MQGVFDGDGRTAEEQEGQFHSFLGDAPAPMCTKDRSNALCGLLRPPGRAALDAAETCVHNALVWPSEIKTRPLNKQDSLVSNATHTHYHIHLPSFLFARRRQHHKNRHRPDEPGDAREGDLGAAWRARVHDEPQQKGHDDVDAVAGRPR